VVLSLDSGSEFLSLSITSVKKMFFIRMIEFYKMAHLLYCEGLQIGCSSLLIRSFKVQNNENLFQKIVSYSIFARKTFQNSKHIFTYYVNRIPKLHKQYHIKFIVINEDFPKLIAETLNSFFSKLVNNERRLYITQPTIYLFK
jgi:hypothetical protein